MALNRSSSLRTEPAPTMLAVATYAVAMAWVEAAVVFYLRLLTGDNMDPYQPNPFPRQVGIGSTEVVREAATLIMLLAVGTLAGRTWRIRIAYTLLAFGLWDIFYYVFLRLITGWPHSIFAWDILFLIPLPWWGPVIAPVSIAFLMIAWSSLAIATADAPPGANGIAWTREAWSLCGAGIGIALYVFMTDALRLAWAGTAYADLRNSLPTAFNWPLFGLAWLLMAAPVFRIAVDAARAPARPERGACT